ncbi:UV DNA damage repair endonuclease UvsE [Paenibacillus sp. J2TS4]|uniref:UV DNA damage repair endonuclease UvsE n=1 Tax=Paenibacillus sp. J2TS4 TaxID=2807194 RepID=UPI001B1E6321|nr:UV DNA damage repair endonuclease UvsE [Paenibacillus sp. J2TS4]GIP34727.1 UV damage endonuclease UvsE [Paenibacillus sp. J2TS4]
MIVRFGYVAMSVVVKNASPSRTMTATQFAKLPDREAAVRKLERIAEENLHNTLRLLRHNRAYDIHMYRFSSRLIPLIGHEMLRDWNPFPILADKFAEVGDYVRQNGMRTSFHPDHYTVLSSPREEVVRSSVDDLRRHVRMLDAMGLDETAKCNIHIGGAYGDREQSLNRFIEQFRRLDDSIQRRLTLENDDKTYTALETLTACESLGVPMVLDIHHHQVNDGGADILDFWPRILKTWEPERKQAEPLGAPTAVKPVKDGKGMNGSSKKGLLPALPPKIHVSSPRSSKEPRAHADYVDRNQLLGFLRPIAAITPRLDVMIEAKKKDGALFQLMDELKEEANVRVVDQATIEIE